VLALTIFPFDRDEEGSGQVEEVHLLVAVLQEGGSIPVRKLTEMGFDLTWLQRLVWKPIRQTSLNPTKKQTNAH